MFHPLTVIGNFFGVTFPVSVMSRLGSWLDERIRTIQPESLLPGPVDVQEADTFVTDLIRQLGPILLDEPSSSTHGESLPAELSTAMNNLHRAGSVQIYGALLDNIRRRQAQVRFEMLPIDQQATKLQYDIDQTKRKADLIIQIQSPVDRNGPTHQLVLDLWDITDQAMAMANRINSTTGESFDTMQKWYEQIVEVICTAREQVQSVLELVYARGMKENLEKVLDRTVYLLELMAAKGFIVEEQPPRVMKINLKYKAAVRHLMGKELKARIGSSTLKTLLISENQVAVFLNDNGRNLPIPYAELSYEGGTFDLVNNHFIASYRNLHTPNFKRQRDLDEHVTDKKFAILFHFSFSMRGNMTFKIWTISNPMVLISHGSQEPQAWATIVWDNAFANPNRRSFDVKDHVSWNSFAKMLDQKFTSSTGCSLSSQNVHSLGEKATGMILPTPIPDEVLITRNQLFRDALPGRDFTFWTWFYATIRVIRENLKEIWNDNLIIGFQERTRAQLMLRESPPGTFIIRFSESILGGITISYTNRNHQFGHIDPLTVQKAGLSVARNLVQQIRDLPQLKRLYPAIPKDEAFQKYFLSLPLPPEGYVPPVPEVELLEDQPMSMPEEEGSSDNAQENVYRQLDSYWN